MIAGIDFGSTLVKAVWKREWKEGDVIDRFNSYFKYASTRTYTLENIIEQLKNDSVTRLNIVGIHYKGEALPGFELKFQKGNPIEEEISMQVEGTKKLLALDGIDYLKDFLIVSIGTGTSYTSVRNAFFEGEYAQHFPIGNSISGGFILGLGKCLGAKNFKEIVECARNGKPADLLIKDVLPSTKEPQQDYVIASFGKEAKTIDDVYATVISAVATATVKDILAMGVNPEFNHRNIVYIGSSVQHNPVLKAQLELTTKIFKKNPYFPRKCAYALAMGAYLEGKRLD